MDREKLEQTLSQMPLYVYTYINPSELEFSQRIRYICQAECPMYGKTWACPPGVGSVDSCRQKCLSYNSCLLIGTIVEVEDVSNIQMTLATRPEHEAITNEVLKRMRQLGADPFVLSTEACAICSRCAILDGQPCRYPERMHPCLESHGINIIPILEANGLDFQYGENMVTWYSLLFYK